jgi:hypothetical protein
MIQLETILAGKLFEPTNVPETCLTSRQELSHQRVTVGLASPDNSDTHDCNGGRCRRCRRSRRGSCGGVTSYTLAASVEDQSWRSYRLHRGGSGGGLETSHGGASGGQGASGHRGSLQQESWTGGGAARARTQRAGVYAPGLGQPAGPRHSPAPTGVRRGTSDGH